MEIYGINMYDMFYRQPLMLFIKQGSFVVKEKKNREISSISIQNSNKEKYDLFLSFFNFNADMLNPLTIEDAFVYSINGGIQFDFESFREYRSNINPKN